MGCFGLKWRAESSSQHIKFFKKLPLSQKQSSFHYSYVPGKVETWVSYHFQPKVLAGNDPSLFVLFLVGGSGCKVRFNNLMQSQI